MLSAKALRSDSLNRELNLCRFISLPLKVTPMSYTVLVPPRLIDLDISKLDEPILRKTVFI